MKNSKEEITQFLEALTAQISDEELLTTTLQASIASSILSARISAGMSQKDLADKLSVKQSQVSKWENGNVNYTLSTLVKLALALNMEIRSPFPRPVSQAYTAPEPRNNLVPFPSNQCKSAAHYSTAYGGDGFQTLQEM